MFLPNQHIGTRADTRETRHYRAAVIRTFLPRRHEFCPWRVTGKYRHYRYQGRCGRRHLFELFQHTASPTLVPGSILVDFEVVYPEEEFQMANASKSESSSDTKSQRNETEPIVLSVLKEMLVLRFVKQVLVYLCV